MMSTLKRIAALFLVMTTLWGITACSDSDPWYSKIEDEDEQQAPKDNSTKDTEHETSVSDNINSNTPPEAENTSNGNTDNNTPEIDNTISNEFNKYKNLSPQEVYQSLLEAEDATIILVETATQLGNAEETNVIIEREGNNVSVSYDNQTIYYDLNEGVRIYLNNGTWDTYKSSYENWEMLVNSNDMLPKILGSCFAEGNYTSSDNQYNLTQEGIANINSRYGETFEQICGKDYSIEATMNATDITYTYYFKIFNTYEDISRTFHITVDFNDVAIELPEVEENQDDENDNDTNTEDAPDENVTNIVNIIMDNIDQWETVSDDFTRKYTYDDVATAGLCLYSAGQYGEYYLGALYTMPGTGVLTTYHQIFYVTENAFELQYGSEYSENDFIVKNQHILGMQFFSPTAKNKEEYISNLIESSLKNEKAYFDEISLYPDETIELSNEEYSLYYNMHSAIQELEYYEPRSIGNDVLLPLVRIAYYDLGDGKCEALLYYGSIIGNSFSGYVVGYAINEEGYSKLSNEDQERLENTSNTVKMNWNVEWTAKKKEYMLQKSITEQ